ncbi:3-methyl-2-oxobutanoate hydroxymethyltransferase [Haloplanus sp. GCM10025708]|uniref:3-methyl-2-oxobutanoate hydroxymethyltransferase n=1 Tax=Haloferacaceae TaxID=1644056 RepID=UPI0036184A3A
MPTVETIRTHSGEPITMLTAYDAPTAEIVDEAGVDVILVGDSMGNAVLGYESTLPVTFDEVASRTAAVVRAVEDALVVADLPFLSYGTDEATSVENAGRLLKEAGADAVKLECGPHTVDLTERLVQLGIPVMGHLGLTPQHVNQLGGYARRGTETEEATEIRQLARSHEDAGAFSLVLEHVPAALASQVSNDLDVPVIGIGAGSDVDGQVLVLTDVVGLSKRSPPFAEQFGDVREELASAVTAYRDAVVDGTFPRSDGGDEPDS